MPLDFPASPSTGATYTGPNGVVWIWDGVKWTVGTQSGAYLPLSGGTLTGDLTIAVPGALNSELILNKSATGDHCVVYGARAGAIRWTLNLATGLDTGGNGGSDFELGRWSDAQVATPALSINRATGTATFGGALATPNGVWAANGSISVGSQTPMANLQGGSALMTHLVTWQLLGFNAYFDGAGNWRRIAAGYGFELNGDTSTGALSLGIMPSGAAGATGVPVPVFLVGANGEITQTGPRFLVGGAFGASYAILNSYEFGQFSSFYAPDGSAGTGGIIYGNAANPQSTYGQTAHYFQNRNRSTNYCQFTSAGTANVSGAWQVISGEAVKENIAPYTRGLDAILALEPMQFRYRAGTPFAADDAPSRPLFGLIAEQVRPHVPEIVGEVDLHTRSLENSATTRFDTLEPGNLIYACINAIKELAAEIAALKGETPLKGTRK